MSLSNAAVVTGGTLSVAGGSALTFSSFGSSPGVVELGVPADTDFRLRRTATCQYKAPRVSKDAPNGYTQARAIATYRKPKLLANGKYTVNTIQVSIQYDPETTDAEKQELMDVAAQFGFDADFVSFFKSGSLA